jgi:putative endonuclease
MSQHQDGLGSNYTSKRLPVKLVYCEEYDRIADAFYREKQVQGWTRRKREALINDTPEILPALAKKVFDRSKIEKVNFVDGEFGG